MVLFNASEVFFMIHVFNCSPKLKVTSGVKLKTSNLWQRARQKITLGNLFDPESRGKVHEVGNRNF